MNTAIEVHIENCIHDWHRKLGHRDPEHKKMHTDGLVDEFILVDCGFKLSCDTCSIYRNDSRSNSEKVIECIRGATGINTYRCLRSDANGKRYSVTFIDDEFYVRSSVGT